MLKKVGRNDPCPCGSGVKFKKCCGSLITNSFSETNAKEIPILNPNNSFPMLTEKVKKLKPIMFRYDFDCLVKAVFCINICIKNRSALENALALNQVLLEYEPLEHKDIANYDSFSLFFNEIKDILEVTVYDDYTINDFGEVKFIWNGKHYDVIIGTGYEQTYGYYQFLPQVVNVNKSESLCKELLEYITVQINYFKDINIADEKYEVRFVVPTRKLFVRVQEYFKNHYEQEKYINLVSYFNKNTEDITRTHFVEHNKVTYPLFNTSILIDFYSYQLKNKSHGEIIDIVDLTIIGLLSKLTNMQNPQNPSVLYPVSLVDEHKYLTEVIHTFLIISNDGIILGINGGRYKKEEVDNELKLIHQLHDNNKLIFSEAISKKGTNQKLAIKIDSKQKIRVFIYENIADPTIPLFIPKEKYKNYIQCLAVDLIYLLSFMDSISEISRFYDHKVKLTSQTMSYGGISDYYFGWKDSDEIIEKGAVSYDTISIMHGNSDGYVHDYFKEKLSNFPWCCDNDSIFDYFHIWKILPKEDSFFEYVNKIDGCFGGIGRTYYNNCFIFYVHNVEFYGSYSDKVMSLISLIDDLNLRNAKLYNSWFEENEFFDNKIIQLMFMPINYAKSVDHNGFTEEKNRIYVYSDMLLTKNKILIRYTINEEELYVDLEKATDRSVEAKYYLELLKPLERVAYNEYQQLRTKINEGINLPKGVGVVSVLIDYKWSDKFLGYHLQDKEFHLVRKEIAKLCNKIGIQDGEYKGKETNKIIRKIQTELINYFETYITQFDMFELHKELLSTYSKVLHNINIHKKRYHSFTNIEEFELIKVQNKTIEMREEDKHHLRVVEFALETNLSIESESDRGKVAFSRDAITFILAFSNWLVVLFDTADICHKSEVDKHIHVRHDFVIEIIDSEKMMKKLEGMSKRVYDNNDYSVKFDDIDKKHLEEVIDAFGIDTGIDMKKLLSLLDFLTLIFNDQFTSEIHPNVFSCTKEDLITSFLKEYDGQINRIEVSNIIDYLILNPKKLKLWKDKLVNFLPINERENRLNRFNLKPIVEINNQLIFSPAVMSDLQKKWSYGITDFYLPYEIGLHKTVECIMNWKKRYEDLIVDDVVQIFKDLGFKHLWKEAWLHKLDKLGSHPISLGDYDVLAFDDSNNILWVIECKVLNKVGSIHENYMQQYNFFLNKKYDEKFQRRIDYIGECYTKILEAQNIRCFGNIKIKPLMITNKVFFSRYKDIQFEIVTLHEFKCKDIFNTQI